MVVMGNAVASAFDIRIAPASSPSPAGQIPCGLPGGACAPTSAMGRAKTIPAMGRGSLLARATTTAARSVLSSSRTSALPAGPDVSRFTPGRSGFGGALGPAPSSSSPVAPSPGVPNAAIDVPAAIALPSAPSVSLGDDPLVPGEPAALERAADKVAAATDRADQSEFAVKVPTWLLAAGGVAFVGLGLFALHRTLPSKRHAK